MYLKNYCFNKSKKYLIPPEQIKGKGFRVSDRVRLQSRLLKTGTFSTYHFLRAKRVS